jgi:hypothetical protein
MRHSQPKESDHASRPRTRRTSRSHRPSCRQDRGRRESRLPRPLTGRENRCGCGCRHARTRRSPADLMNGRRGGHRVRPVLLLPSRSLELSVRCGLRPCTLADRHVDLTSRLPVHRPRLKDNSREAGGHPISACGNVDTDAWEARRPITTEAASGNVIERAASTAPRAVPIHDLRDNAIWSPRVRAAY